MVLVGLLGGAALAWGQRLSGTRGATRPALAPVSLPETAALASADQALLTAQQAQVQALEGDPGSSAEQLSAAYGRLGQMLLAFDFSDSARPALENAAALAATEPRWPYYLGYLHAEAGRLAEAAAAFESARRLSPDDGATQIRLAMVYRDLGRSDEAAELARQALAADPTNARAELLLGQLAQESGEPQVAAAHYERVLALQPAATSVYYQLSAVYRALGDQAKSDDFLARRGDGQVVLNDTLIAELNEVAQGAAVLLQRGNEALRAQDFAGAAAAFGTAVAREPENATAWLNLGAARGGIGDRAGAVAALATAVALDPASAKAQFNLGFMLAAGGDDTAALEAFRAAMARDPQYVRAHVELGRLLYRKGRWSDALKEVEAALAVEPGNVEAHLLRAGCLVQLERPDEAVELLEATRTQLPANPDLDQVLARLLATRPGGAERALVLAQALVKERQDPSTLSALALAQAAAGDAGAAGELLRGALERAQAAGLDTLWLDYLRQTLQQVEVGTPIATPWPSFMIDVLAGRQAP